MPKPELEFRPSSSFPESLITPDDPSSSGYTTVRVLSHDLETRDKTMILRHPPGAHWGGEGKVTHEYWEECYILKGRLRDKGLDKWFEAGSYCCRPPGMEHGPYEADAKEGCEEICIARLGGRRVLHWIIGMRLSSSLARVDVMVVRFCCVASFLDKL